MYLQLNWQEKNMLLELLKDNLKQDISKTNETITLNLIKKLYEEIEPDNN